MSKIPRVVKKDEKPKINEEDIEPRVCIEFPTADDEDRFLTVSKYPDMRIKVDLDFAIPYIFFDAETGGLVVNLEFKSPYAK